MQSGGTGEVRKQGSAAEEAEEANATQRSIGGGNGCQNDLRTAQTTSRCSLPCAYPLLGAHEACHCGCCDVSWSWCELYSEPIVGEYGIAVATLAIYMLSSWPTVFGAARLAPSSSQLSLKQALPAVGTGSNAAMLVRLPYWEGFNRRTHHPEGG